jgi:hypothetical protein
MEKIFLITALVLIVTTPFVGESFAVEQKYIDLMDSYVKNVTDQIMDTEGIAISNYVSYINETLTN